MSLVRRFSNSVPGASLSAPVLSALGVPERRSRVHTARVRRRARHLLLARVVAYGLCFGTGVLGGLWTARALTSQHAPGTADRAAVSVRTLTR